MDRITIPLIILLEISNGIFIEYLSIRTGDNLLFEIDILFPNTFSIKKYLVL
jgi:hypothetical protein